MMKKIGMLLFLVSLSAGAENKHFLSGNDLYEHMISENPMYSIGYISGVVDVMLNIDEFSACLEGDINLRQIFDIVESDMVANPQDRSLSATVIVMTSVAGAFGC